MLARDEAPDTRPETWREFRPGRLLQNHRRASTLPFSKDQGGIHVAKAESRFDDDPQIRLLLDAMRYRRRVRLDLEREA